MPIKRKRGAMSQINTTIQPVKINVYDILIRCVKQVVTASAIYLIGKWNQSFLWVLVPLLAITIRNELRKRKNQKRDFVRDLNEYGEKQVLACISDLPTWVYFPDFESADWLNKITQQMWPYVNHYAKDYLTDYYEEWLKQTFEGYQLKGFKFERVVLGSQPFRIGGVKVYPNERRKDEICMDFNISYAGDCNITFHLAGTKGGIRNFQLYGRLRVVLKPLISTSPLVGGVQAYFLKNPDINFDFFGIAQILEIPGLNELIKKVIVDSIAYKMVLPNKYFYKLSDEVSAKALVEIPKGALRVHLIEAKDLLKKDIKLIGKGKSDPYAILRVESQEQRSKVIIGNVNPQWDDWFEFKVLEISGQYLYLDIWDKDATEDEFLGSCAVDINNVIKNEKIDSWIQLEKVKHGMVHLRLTWFSLSTNYDDLQAVLEETQELHVHKMSSCFLTVVIDSASNVPSVRSSINPDPFVVVQVGKTKYQTKIQEKTVTPVWEEDFTFFITNPDTELLNVSIFDNKTETALGELAYKVNNLSEKENLEVIQQPFKLLNGIELILSMHLRVFKNPDRNTEETMYEEYPSDASTSVSRSDSKKSDVSDKKKSLNKQDSFISNSSGASSNFNEESALVISSSEISEFGKIRMTLRYSVQRQRLIVVIHKLENIPYKDPDDLPNLYVKLYLLPGRDKDSKRKTKIHKNTTSPEFDETFEYLISHGELATKQVEVSVVEDKVMKNPTLGMFVIDLNKYDLKTAITGWFHLEEEK